jgi:hypothetical protein
MHDGDPAHLILGVSRYLNQTFPGRWTGRDEPTAWPPSSPNLNPVDFYLWSYLRSLVNLSLVGDVETLRTGIVACD